MLVLPTAHPPPSKHPLKGHKVTGNIVWSALNTAPDAKGHTHLSHKTFYPRP